MAKIPMEMPAISNFVQVTLAKGIPIAYSAQSATHTAPTLAPRTAADVFSYDSHFPPDVRPSL
eukprot:6181219-Pleurochrysis_carterae.AAC.1